MWRAHAGSPRTARIIETWPRVRGKTRLNPGLVAREKLSPVKPEAEKAASNLHGLRMAGGGREVKCGRARTAFGRLLPFVVRGI